MLLAFFFFVSSLAPMVMVAGGLAGIATAALYALLRLIVHGFLFFSSFLLVFPLGSWRACGCKSGGSARGVHCT